MKRLSILLLCLSFICSSFAQGQSDAQFPGGDKAFQQYFRETVNYPSGIKKKKDFNVVADILIKEDGTVTLAKIKKPLNVKDGVLREVKHLIKMMPKWKPATKQTTDGILTAEKSLVEVTIHFTQRLYMGKDETVVSVDEAGTLAQRMSTLQQDTCSALTIRGQLNSSDILTLRRMAGGDGGKGRLKHLDLSHAKIITDKSTPYLTLDAMKCRIKTVMNTETVDGGTRIPETADYSAYSFQGGPFQYQQLDKATIKHTTFVINDNKTDNDDSKGDWYEQRALNKARLKKKALRKFQGHTLTMEDGHCIFRAYTQKGTYCKDMFYHCPQLKYVMMPWNHQRNDKVRVEYLNHLYLY